MKRWNPQVGFVAPIRKHRLCISQPWNLAFDLLTGSFANAPDQRFDHLEDLLFLRERRLKIDLGKLRLTVGAKIFIPKAADDLKIPFLSADHQQLLEDLGRLRKRIETARLGAARDQVI